MGISAVTHVPTIKDRVQVLLEPQEWADLTQIRKEEKRSAGQMGAILIAEAIAARKLNGTFVPETDRNKEELEIARLRRTAKQTGKPLNSLVEKATEKDEMSAKDLLKALQKIVEEEKG